MSDRPFGFDTIDVPAFLAQDGDDTLGFDALKIPAILVPEGEDPPAGDWVNAGVVLRPRPPNGADRPVPATQPDDSDPRDLPRTRYRNSGGIPPIPAHDKDPVAAGMKALRGMAPGRATDGKA
jgi:hypothetical protein